MFSTCSSICLKDFHLVAAKDHCRKVETLSRWVIKQSLGKWHNHFYGHGNSTTSPTIVAFPIIRLNKCKLLNNICNMTKYYAFLITDVKISHRVHCIWIERSVAWINTPVHYSVIPPMGWEFVMTSQMNQFMLASSSDVWWMPPSNTGWLLQQD